MLPESQLTFKKMAPDKHFAAALWNRSAWSKWYTVTEASNVPYFTVHIAFFDTTIMEMRFSLVHFKLPDCVFVLPSYWSQIVGACYSARYIIAIIAPLSPWWYHLLAQIHQSGRGFTAPTAGPLWLCASPVAVLRWILLLEISTLHWGQTPWL